DLGESRTNDESHKAEKQPAAEKHADEKKVLDSLGAAVESSLARVMIWTEAKIMRLLDEGMGDALVQSSVDVGRHLLMKAVVDALGGSSGSIRRRVGNQLELVPGAVGYETIRDLRHEIDLTDKSLAARAFVYNKTMVVNDTFHDPMSRSFRAQFTGTQDSDRRMREYLGQGGSYAAAPLRDAFGQKLGTVLIQAKKRWWFYKYHLRCLDAFGDRVRTVVDHLESTLPANFLLQIGDELPTAAHSSSLDHALKVLVQNFQKACQAQVVSLFLWEPSFERFLLYAEAGWKKSGWEFKAQYAEHEGWTGSVALEDEPHYEKDLREYKKRTRSDRDMGIYEPAMFGSRDDVVATASLGLPLKAGGKRLGVLIALRRYYKGEKPEPFVTTDQKVLIQAADRIAGYVSVLLLQRLERLEKEREERYRAINQAISAADGPESAPETLLCRELRGQYQAEQVSFYGKNLECLACEPGPPHSPDDLLEQVSRNLEPEFKRIELDEQERADPECRKSYGLLQRACIPLSLKTLLGIIDIRWHEDVKRTDHPLRHGYEKEMKALGAMIASVYQRYLTGSELKRAERDAAAWGGHKANIIDAMIAPAKQALHRCNNIDWLLEGLQKMIVAGDDLNGIKRRIKEIRFKTRQLPRAMRFLKEGAQPVRTHELVDSLVKEAMAELDWGEDGNKDEDGNKGQDIKVQFGVAEGLAVCVSRAWIVEAFYNIADNAIRAIRDKGKPGAFIISATATGGKARIVFKDSGVGMSDEELELVLKGSHKPKLHRTGVGLPLTRVLIAEQDGEFRVNSLQGFGTEAIVNLPLVKENGSCHIRQ
ncbi:MAG TPA: ATP-binding protein, partial [Candidatus Angelobacter sp.]|nr:ATP-binding protein [Candidatus Angelobacter sp.]